MASAENTGVVNFPVPGGTWTDPTQFSIMTASTGGTTLYNDNLDTNVDAPVQGAAVRFAAGAITITLVNGDASNDGAIAALKGLLVGTRYLRLLTSAGAEVSGTGYARVAIAQGDWTYS